MCGSSSNKLTKLFFPLEAPENIFIDSDTFFTTSITLETCIETDLYPNDMEQDKWVVSERELQTYRHECPVQWGGKESWNRR